MAENHCTLKSCAGYVGGKIKSRHEEVTGKRPQQIAANLKKIREVFGVDDSSDKEELQLQFLCNSCYKRLFYTTKQRIHMDITSPI